jgi:hypothetical protein
MKCNIETIDGDSILYSDTEIIGDGVVHNEVKWIIVESLGQFREPAPMYIMPKTYKKKKKKKLKKR